MQTHLKNLVVGSQMLFTAFGALVLVPILTGFFQLTSLSFAPVLEHFFSNSSQEKGSCLFRIILRFYSSDDLRFKKLGDLRNTLRACRFRHILYVLISALLKWRGSNFLHRILPSIVTGPIIMLIGMILAPVAVNMAVGKTGMLQQFSSLKGKRWPWQSSPSLQLLFVLSGKRIRSTSFNHYWTVGYIISLFMGMVSFEPIANAAFVALPDFILPTWSLEAILFIVPVAIAPAIEHYGDISAIGNVTKKNYVEEPGLHRTMLGDGLATTVSSFLGDLQILPILRLPEL